MGRPAPTTSAPSYLLWLHVAATRVPGGQRSPRPEPQLLAARLHHPPMFAPGQQRPLPELPGLGRGVPWSPFHGLSGLYQLSSWARLCPGSLPPEIPRAEVQGAGSCPEGPWRPGRWLALPSLPARPSVAVAVTPWEPGLVVSLMAEAGAVGRTAVRNVDFLSGSQPGFHHEPAFLLAVL